jgi:hypothetical protein
MPKIKVTYEVEDGYGGGSRPQHVEIDSDDFEGLSKADASLLLADIIQEDFSSRITWVMENYDGAVAELMAAAAKSEAAE